MPTKLSNLNLRPELVTACRRQGFDEATPIQAIVIPVLLGGHDAVVEAKTGSGKTLAYGLPLLNAEPRQTQYPEALVVAPTRELALQIDAELRRTAGTLERPVVALTGRGGMDSQSAQLDAGAYIVVGTLGRLQELLERGLLRLDHVRTLVLDEIDMLLAPGSSENLAQLLAKLPKDRQTVFLSATVPTEVEKLAKRIAKSPQRLRVAREREQVAELTHRVLFTSTRDRLHDLVRFLKAERPYQTLIFCGTRHEVEEVREAIAELGVEAEFLHGELSPLRRRQILAKFRTGDLPVLVASDLASRGLDLPGVDVVVNYSLPRDSSWYLHRAGRTGRAGRPGTVVSLVIEQQQPQLQALKATYQFEAVDPSGRVRELKTREERDLEFRKLPRVKPKPEPRPAPARPPRPGRGKGRAQRGRRPGRR